MVWKPSPFFEETNSINVGTAAVIGPGVKIAAGSVIGSQAYVSKDITEPGIYVGVPAVKKK